MGRGTVYSFVAAHLQRQIKFGSKVLETGCGAAKYREVVRSVSAEYVGTDVFNDHYQDPGDIDVCCSSDALPFASGTFDLVFNQGAIDYMPNLARTLLEARRVLRRHGKLIIYTYNTETLEAIDRNCRQSGRSWELHHHVFTPSELIEAMSKAGFVSRDVSGDIETWSPDTWWRSVKMKMSGELTRRRLNHSIWRAYVGQARG